MSSHAPQDPTDAGESVPPQPVDPTQKNSRDFGRIVAVSVALGMGAAAASSQALRLGSGGFHFHVSAWTWLAFVASSLATFLYWNLVVAADLQSPRGGASLPLRLLPLILAGLGMFLYPLRFVPRERLPEIAEALAMVVLALSAGGYGLWQLNRFFESDDLQNRER